MKTPQLADALRAAVLQAAIKGELTARSSENACDLLAQIQNKKQALQAKGSLKKAKAPAPVSADEVPFDIPENWVWVRLGEIADINSGVTFKKTDQVQSTPSNIRVLRGGNIKNDSVYFLDDDIYLPPNSVKDGLLLEKNDILTPAVTSIENVGKFGIIKENPVNTVCGGFVFRLRLDNSFVNAEYLFIALRSSIVISQMKERTRKSGQAFYNLGKENFKTVMLPLPPLAEQQAIAEKLTRLLAEIDRLKAEEQSLASLQKAYPQTLRASVLAAAVRGDLNERSQEHARDLLLQIQNEKQALQAKGSLKKTKAPAPVSADEVPFEIPENWVWVRLGDYLQFIDYRGMTPQKIENGVRLITAANIKKGFFDNSTAAYISEDEYQQRKSRGVTELGDVLFTTEAPLGHCCLNPFEKASCGQRIITFKPFVKTDYVNQFIVYVINSAFFQKAIHDNKSGVTAKGIKAATLKTLPIPLPPLAEQQAIVEKLTRLLAEIDALENA